MQTMVSRLGFGLALLLATSTAAVAVNIASSSGVSGKVASVFGSTISGSAQYGVAGVNVAIRSSNILNNGTFGAGAFVDDVRDAGERLPVRR